MTNDVFILKKENDYVTCTIYGDRVIMKRFREDHSKDTPYTCFENQIEDYPLETARDNWRWLVNCGYKRYNPQFSWDDELLK